MKIRLAEERDLEQIANTYCSAFNRSSKERWPLEKAKQLFEYWLQRQPDLFFVAEEENTIIGAVVSNAKPWYDGIRLQDGEIFVDPQYQQRGLGRELLIKLIEEGVSRYQTSVFEGITFTNTQFPLSWYNKIGLKKDDELVIITGECKDILENLKANI